jgi:hypothetical protein
MLRFIVRKSTSGRWRIIDAQENESFFLEDNEHDALELAAYLNEMLTEEPHE